VSAGALANLIHNTISLPAFDAIQKICTFEYQHLLLIRSWSLHQVNRR
jgi:hypothetical protein